MIDSMPEIMSNVKSRSGGSLLLVLTQHCSVTSRRRPHWVKFSGVGSIVLQRNSICSTRSAWTLDFWMGVNKNPEYDGFITRANAQRIGVEDF